MAAAIDYELGDKTYEDLVMFSNAKIHQSIFFEIKQLERKYKKF